MVGQLLVEALIIALIVSILHRLTTICRNLASQDHFLLKIHRNGLKLLNNVKDNLLVFQVPFFLLFTKAHENK